MTAGYHNGSPPPAKRLHRPLWRRVGIPSRKPRFLPELVSSTELSDELDRVRELVAGSRVNAAIRSTTMRTASAIFPPVDFGALSDAMILLPPVFGSVSCNGDLLLPLHCYVECGLRITSFRVDLVMSVMLKYSRAVHTTKREAATR